MLCQTRDLGLAGGQRDRQVGVLPWSYRRFKNSRFSLVGVAPGRTVRIAAQGYRAEGAREGDVVRKLLILCVAAIALVAATPVSASADNDGSAVEIGVEWVGQYAGTGSPVQKNLYTSDSAVGGLHDIVSDPTTAWGWQFNYGDDLAWELDWRATRLGGMSESFTDNVDLAAYAGHGQANKMVLGTEWDSWYVLANSLDAGDRDCEWLLTFTCRYLTGSNPTDFRYMMNGVHLVCGYTTDMTITSNAGSMFAYYAKEPYRVRVAWYKYGQATQLGEDLNVARTFGAKSCVNDCLWGYGSVAADPPSYSASPSSYSWWDTKLGW